MTHKNLIFFLRIFFLFFIVTNSYALKIINIFPVNEKQSTDLYIKKGDTIQIEASGQWSLWDKYKPVGPGGHDFEANELGNWGLLLGQIGNNAPFVISNQIEFISEYDGLLYLFPNKGQYKIINESGKLEITINGGTEIENFKKGLSENAKKFVFESTDDYLKTDLYVKKGEQLEIYSFGKWTMWEDHYPLVNADGHDFIINDIPWGKLYGGIGSSYQIFLETFPIGMKSLYTPEVSGILSFYPYTEDYVTSKGGSLEIYIVGGNEANEADKNNTDEYVRKKLELQLMSRINEIRSAAGLQEIESNSTLSETAFNHAKYMVINNTFSRDEEESLEGFTGVNPEERAKNKGIEFKTHEMFYQSKSALKGLNIYIDSIYHRLRLLNPYLKYIGYGNYQQNKKNIHVLDMAFDKENTEEVPDAMIFPADNMGDVPYSWSGLENPDPFPNGTIKPLGYPVSIMFNKKIIKVNKATIVEAEEPDIELKSFIISPETDLNNKDINAVIIVTKKVLTPLTTYIINVTVELDGDEKAQEYTWSFTTAK